MTNESVSLVTEIMMWLGIIFSAPLLGRVSYQLTRFLLVKFKAHSQIILVDENGNEINLAVKGIHTQQELIEHLRKTVNGSR